jgi:predicted nucleotidyltransferase
MMLWTKEEILKVLEQERDTIRQYGARRLGLFGSYARGEATEQSDLDFIVEFERKSFDAYMDLREFLEKRFNCPVDLVIADAVKPALRHPIIDQAIYASGL